MASNMLFGVIGVFPKSSKKMKKRLELKKEKTVFGRKTDCDIRILDGKISGHHCVLEVISDIGTVRIRDLNSHKCNGLTLVNGVLKKEAILCHNDTFSIIGRKFQFEYPVESLHHPENAGYISPSATLNRELMKEECKSYCSLRSRDFVSGNSASPASITNRFEEKPLESDPGHNLENLPDENLLSTPTNNEKLKKHKSPFIDDHLSILKKRRVLFGPKLSPEEFDKTLPPSSPLIKGKKPFEHQSLTSSSYKGSEEPGTSGLKQLTSILKRNSSVTFSRPATPYARYRTSLPASGFKKSSRKELKVKKFYPRALLFPLEIKNLEKISVTDISEEVSQTTPLSPSTSVSAIVQSEPAGFASPAGMNNNPASKSSHAPDFTFGSSSIKKTTNRRITFPSRLSSESKVPKESPVSWQIGIPHCSTPISSISHSKLSQFTASTNVKIKNTGFDSQMSSEKPLLSPLFSAIDIEGSASTKTVYSSSYFERRSLRSASIKGSEDLVSQTPHHFELDSLQARKVSSKEKGRSHSKGLQTKKVSLTAEKQEPLNTYSKPQLPVANIISHKRATMAVHNSIVCSIKKANAETKPALSKVSVEETMCLRTRSVSVKAKMHQKCPNTNKVYMTNALESRSAKDKILVKYHQKFQKSPSKISDGQKTIVTRLRCKQNVKAGESKMIDCSKKLPLKGKKNKQKLKKQEMLSCEPTGSIKSSERVAKKRRVSPEVCMTEAIVVLTKNVSQNVKNYQKCPSTNDMNITDELKNVDAQQKPQNLPSEISDGKKIILRSSKQTTGNLRQMENENADINNVVTSSVNLSLKNKKNQRKCKGKKSSDQVTVTVGTKLQNKDIEEKAFTNLGKKSRKLPDESFTENVQKNGVMMNLRQRKNETTQENEKVCNFSENLPSRNKMNKRVKEQKDVKNSFTKQSSNIHFKNVEVRRSTRKEFLSKSSDHKNEIPDQKVFTVQAGPAIKLSTKCLVKNVKKNKSKSTQEMKENILLDVLPTSLRLSCKVNKRQKGQSATGLHDSNAYSEVFVKSNQEQKESLKEIAEFKRVLRSKSTAQASNKVKLTRSKKPKSESMLSLSMMKDEPQAQNIHLYGKQMKLKAKKSKSRKAVKNEMNVHTELNPDPVIVFTKKVTVQPVSSKRVTRATVKRLITV